MMRIAVDAMGGDIGPPVVIPGAVAGARAHGVALTFTGQRDAIDAELATVDTAGLDIRVLDAPINVEMDENPTQAVRRKPNSSISVALREMRNGSARAMVSAGNSGAVMAAALLLLGRVPGVERPAFATYLPSARSRTLVLDLGAVSDPKPANIVQFALMGQVYAERILERPNPTVGLLSNGEEPTKGNQFVREVYPLLAATSGINFYGNVEGNDILLGTVDVVVTDGFTGNVALKAAEGAGAMISEVIRTELTATLPRKLAALMLRPAFRAVKQKLDYSEIGGAAVLGINGAVVVSHGRSNTNAVMNAVRVAQLAAAENLPGAIEQAVRTSSTSDVAVNNLELPTDTLEESSAREV